MQAARRQKNGRCEGDGLAAVSIQRTCPVVSMGSHAHTAVTINPARANISHLSSQCIASLSNFGHLKICEIYILQNFNS